ncbi:MAG: hypothetical protein CM15mP21_5840 [Hyphomicrobiales bacterium]|nr:MAG: hypothetical protein CM15mP21_5840 [Hyphomicrobiales bacterium]
MRLKSYFKKIRYFWDVSREWRKPFSQTAKFLREGHVSPNLSSGSISGWARAGRKPHRLSAMAMVSQPDGLTKLLAPLRGPPAVRVEILRPFFLAKLVFPCKSNPVLKSPPLGALDAVIGGGQG